MDYGAKIVPTLDSKISLRDETLEGSSCCQMDVPIQNRTILVIKVRIYGAKIVPTLDSKISLRGRRGSSGSHAGRHQVVTWVVMGSRRVVMWMWVVKVKVKVKGRHQVVTWVVMSSHRVVMWVVNG
eukprot:scaffold76772_cov23-Cyclotella_meneghiniana.AAC.1